MPSTPGESAPASPDPQRNLQVVVAGAGLVYFGWSWADFSGPFRHFVDLQLRFLHRYAEWAAAIASAVMLIGVVWLAIVLLQRAFPDLSRRTADAVVAIVFVVASVVAVWQVWHLWHEAARMPRLTDPVQTVDLDSMGHAALPPGHVRVIGVPDRSRLVVGHATGRYGMSSYWEAWMPLVSRRSDVADAQVRIVATSRNPDRAAATKAITDNPEGLLLPDSVDTRTIYQARQAGLDMAQRPFALYRDEGVRFDKYTNAAMLGAFVLLFWAMAAFGWIRDRKAGGTLAESTSVEASGGTIAAVLASTAAEPDRTRESSLTRIGTGMAIASIGAGGLLWSMFGFFPNRPGLLGYAAAAVLLLVALFLMWLGQRLEAPTQKTASLGTWDAFSAESLVPPPGAGLLCVLRHEPGFSSPSYKRVDVDGMRVADLKANRYTVVALQPGPHTLAVNTRLSLTSDTVARFALAAGEVVVYRMKVAGSGPLTLERADDVAAVRSVLARLKLVVAAPVDSQS